MKMLLFFASLFFVVGDSVQQNKNQGVCSNKVIFWNGTIDYVVKFCKSSNNSMQFDMEQYNRLSSLMFPAGAKYSDKNDKVAYTINFDKWGKDSIKHIADGLAVYIQCFSNPFATGCTLPQAGCNKISAQNNSLNIIFEHNKAGSLKLKCVSVSSKTQSQQGRRRRGATTTIQRCCPRNKDLICYGCTSINVGVKVSVANCPKGFTCFGSEKVTGGGNGSGFSTGGKGGGGNPIRRLTIVHEARRLLYRQRRSTEKNNSKDELKNLYHLTVIHKALEIISKEFRNQI